jgi:hypothetical protein
MYRLLVDGMCRLCSLATAADQMYMYMYCCSIDCCCAGTRSIQMLYRAVLFVSVLAVSGAGVGSVLFVQLGFV